MELSPELFTKELLSREELDELTDLGYLCICLLGYRNLRGFVLGPEKLKGFFKRENTDNKIKNHFGQASKMIGMGDKEPRGILDHILSS